MAVLNWRVLTTLTTCLLQQLHAQYVPRAAELATAVQSAAGTCVYQDNMRTWFRRVLADAQSTTKGQYSSVLSGVLRTYYPIYSGFWVGGCCWEVAGSCSGIILPGIMRGQLNRLKA